MSKAVDSDIYGDIYGDNDGKQTVINGGHDADSGKATLSHDAGTPAVTSQGRLGPGNGLPPKPSSSTPPTLSYSAQIAQQFSSYKQTPNQERQEKSDSSQPKSIPTFSGSSSIDSTVNGGLSDTVFGKKPSEMHDHGKMFIGGLSWDTTDEGLRNYFSQFGKVDACTIMRDPSGTSRGFAFLTFEDAASTSAVVAREHFLDGKMIDPKRAIPREEHLRNTRFFVGGLAPTTTSDSMREFFSLYGHVVDVTVMVDRESGRSKGFGFVTFDEINNPEQLIGKIGLTLDDKQIEVKLAQPRSQRDQQRRNDPLQNEITTSTPISFAPQQANPTPTMYPQVVGQVPMMTGFNPMAMAMNMGMNRFNPMGQMAGNMTGVAPFNPMGNMGTMAGLGGMNNMMSMGNLGAMRLGMGPMGGMGTMGMGVVTPGAFRGFGAMDGGMAVMRTGAGMMSGGMDVGAGTAPMNAGTGPARVTNRGRNSYHPYAR